MCVRERERERENATQSIQKRKKVDGPSPKQNK
jgi:hypothetical protein